VTVFIAVVISTATTGDVLEDGRIMDGKEFLWAESQSDKDSEFNADSRQSDSFPSGKIQ
jgi:hypothetical protein